MKLYNFARATFRQVPEQKQHEVFLALFLADFPDQSYKTYINYLTCQIEQQLDRIELQENTVFNVEIFSNTHLDFDEFNQIYNSTTAIIANYLTAGNVAREQEWRFSAPHQLCLLYTHIMQLLNYKSKIDTFDIRVFYNKYEIDMVER